MLHKLVEIGRARNRAIYRLRVQHPNHVDLALKAKLARHEISLFKAARAASA